VKTAEIKCKTIINPSGIEGVDYAVNPYIGCAHSCVYCFARFMTRWYHKGEKWGSFVDVKKNAVECMKREAKEKHGIILFSSVTDPYQPIERKRRLTRSLLKTLREYDPPLRILTKSGLVVRDLDIIGEFTKPEVGLTITSGNEEVRRRFEPNASPIRDRLEALEKYSEVGIPTYAFLGPLLPYLSEAGIETLLNSLADKVNRVIVDRLHIKAGNWKPIEETLSKYYPSLVVEFKKASESDSGYYEELRYKMKRLLDARAIPYDILF